MCQVLSKINARTSHTGVGGRFRSAGLRQRHGCKPTRWSPQPWRCVRSWPDRARRAWASAGGRSESREQCPQVVHSESADGRHSVGSWTVAAVDESQHRVCSSGDGTDRVGGVRGVDVQLAVEIQ